jgi:hypothetical protein
MALPAVLRPLTGTHVIRPAALVSDTARLQSTGHAVLDYGPTRGWQKYGSIATVPAGGRTKLSKTYALYIVTRHSHERDKPTEPPTQIACCACI